MATSGHLTLAFPAPRAAATVILTMEREGPLLESYVTQRAKNAQTETPLPERQGVERDQ